MTSSRIPLAFLGLAGVGLLVSAAANAQQVIRIVNADNREVPLEAGSSVQIDTAGNLLARCALTNNVCTALGSGGQVGAPTLSFSRSDGAAPITAGSSITLTWTTTNAEVCNATVGANNPNAAGWPGPKSTANGGSQVTLPAEGEYTLNLQCFNASGGSTVESVVVTVQPGNVNVPNLCTATDPLINPSTLSRVNKTWIQAFSSPNGLFVPSAYPYGLSAPVPIGANKGSYTVISFVPDINVNVNLSFDAAQSNNQYGYSAPRVNNGGMFISISPCPGDLRPINNGQTTDLSLRSSCRIFNTSGGLVYSTMPGSSAGVCRLTKGAQYYINVAAVNPIDGISQGEETCQNPSYPGCDVQASHQATVLP